MKNFVRRWRRAKNIDTNINKVFNIIAAMCILYPVLGITADVAGRYLFDKPIPGTAEIVQMLMAFIVFFGLAYALSEGSFIRVEALTRFLPPRIRLIVEIFTNLIFIIIFGLILWQGTELAIEATQKREFVWGLINIPAYPARWAVPLGALLVLLRLVLNIGDSFMGLFSTDGGRR